MTTVVLELPDEVAARAKSMGILTNDKIVELINTELERITAVPAMDRAAFIRWLEETPIPEPWGDLEESQDAGEYVHEMRRRGIERLEE
jgi:hypothetical protein